MNTKDSEKESQEREFALFRAKEDFDKLSSRLRSEGLWGAVQFLGRKLGSRRRWWSYYLYHRTFDRSFDRRHGVDTCGVVFLSDLTVVSTNKHSGLEYEPTPVRAFDRMLGDLPADLSEFAFIDFGCGKGRTLLLASQRHFKMIRGVEFAKELQEIAEKNIQAFRSDRQICRDIRATWIDAAEYEIPDENCVFYFYYPFHEDVMHKVVGNILASHEKNPRKMYFVNRLDKPEWHAACERVFGEYESLKRNVSEKPSFLHSITAPFTVITYET